MAKKVRNLRLLSNEFQVSETDRKDPFALVASGDLAPAEQKIVEDLVENAAPGSGVIAVVRTERPWDLRPVVLKVGASDPSILRLSGPLGQHVAGTACEATTRLASVLERSSHALENKEALSDWGEYRGRVWYRRTLFHSTLTQQLSSLQLDAFAIASFAQNLIEQVISLHAYGVVHGHISASNIALGADGKPLLLDPGVAFSQRLDGIERALSVAPELRASTSTGSGTLLPSADVYGIGQICQLLVVKAQRESFESGASADLLLDALAQRFEPTLATAESARPALHTLLSQVRDLARSAQPRAAQAQSLAIPASRTQTTAEQAIEVHSQFLSPQPAPQLVNEDVAGDATAHVSGTHPVVSGEQKSMWWVYLIGALSLAFCLWTVQDRMMVEELEIADSDVRVAWSSGLPSKMKPVVELAVEYPRSFAEQLVVRSAIRDEDLPSGINGNLLRLAFDSRWEGALSDRDRTVAMILGTAGFVGHKDTSALEQLSDLHPGVVFAIAASAPSGAQTSLARFSAEGLGSLPGAIGNAFSTILKGQANATCAAPGVQQLARFAAFGITSQADVFLFLQHDFETRSRALTELFSRDEQQSAAIVQTLFQYPNGSLSNPVLDWARKWKFEHWTGVAAGDQLRVLAGLEPKALLDASYIGVLFAHPSERVRKFAVAQARDRIAFAHPGSLQVLSMIVADPSLLSAEQLLSLAKILENPASVSATEMKEWVESAPSPKVLETLLLTTASHKEATTADTFIAMQLNAVNWKASLEQARVLSTHPDEYTRMMTYQQLFTMGSEGSFELLQESMSKESNESYRAQLAEMLAILHASLNP